MRVIVLFLDGVGLGGDDPEVNPLAAARMPVVDGLLGGRRLLAASGRVAGPGAVLVPTDAALGVEGRPQSATGQTALLTGMNAPALLGEHYGPRPNAPLRDMLDGPTLFSRVLDRGQRLCYANAFPAGYFEAVNRGKRLHGAIPHAVTAAGLSLRTADDLAAGRALSVDFTNGGWRDQLGYPQMPLLSPGQAGRNLAGLALDHDLTFFEHWITDLLGHRGDLGGAVHIFEQFDAFLGGLLEASDLARTLIVITSDHGNVEDCGQRNHTVNAVPTLFIGSQAGAAAAGFADLTDFAPTVLRVLEVA